MHFESSLSPRRLMTSILCTLAFKKKTGAKTQSKKTQGWRQVGEAANSPCGSLLCLPLPALEDWACKKFQLQGLRPASIGTVSKKKKKTAEGTSLRRECWLFALSPATLRLSLWDSGGALTALSAPRVTPVHSTALWLPESVLKKLPSPLETESERAGNVCCRIFFLLALVLLLLLITVLHIVFD